IQLVEAADGDVLIAVKPYLASFGAALVAAERREVPVVLDLDDLDVALAPRAEWAKKPSMTDLRRPASAITVSSTALQQRFGGTLVPHGCQTELFDLAAIDRERVRRDFGFDGPTVVFAGTPREHKGLKPLAKAVSQVPGARLAVVCRPQDLADSHWERYPLLRIPIVSYPT